MGVIVFLGLLVGGGYWFLSVYSPSVLDEDIGFQRDYDLEAMQSALDPERVDEIAASLRDFGPRFLGNEGHLETAEFVDEWYRSHGLEVFRLNGKGAALLTRKREIERVDGLPMEGVEIFPFPPNGFQPIVTPGGIEGRLLLLDDQMLIKEGDFDDVIAVIRVDATPRIQEFRWNRYAQFGFKAIILVHPQGVDAFPWSQIMEQGGMHSILPINFPRLAATSELLEHIGERVRIDVDMRFEEVRQPVLVGRIRAPKPAGDALVLTAAYDQYGLLIDHAPNPLQDLPLSVHLALVEGLAAYRDSLQRDVVFVATGSKMAAFSGLDDLLRKIGPKRARGSTGDRLEREIADEVGRLERLERIDAMVGAEHFLRSSEPTSADYQALSSRDRDFFDRQLRYVINSLVFRMSEDVLLKRIEFERGNINDLDRPEYEVYLEAQMAHDDVTAAGGLSLGRLMERIPVGADLSVSFVDAYRIPERVRERFSYLRTFHEEELRDLKAGLEINRAFRDYRDLFVFSPAFLPRLGFSEIDPPDHISFVTGGPFDPFERLYRIQASGMSSLLTRVLQGGELGDVVDFTSQAGTLPGDIYRNVANYPTPSENWNAMGYRAFTFVNRDRTASYRSLPHPIAGEITARGMEGSLQFLGEFALALAHGMGALPEPMLVQPRAYSGSVYVSDVGRSLIPNFPLERALITADPAQSQHMNSMGRLSHLAFFTNPYGRYERINASSPLADKWSFNVQTVYFGGSGLATHFKDEGGRSQKLYRSMDLGSGPDYRDVNLVAFRGTSVAAIDLVNPQTLRPFSNVVLLRQGSLTNFDRINTFSSEEGVVNVIPPDEYFFATFRAGSPENELVQVTRSFMAGDPPERLGGQTDITGKGFLALDHAILHDSSFEQARSMNRLNATRLVLQQERDLADRHTVAFHERSSHLLMEAGDPGKSLSFYERLLAARDSLTYSIIVHPILRENINNAIISILWYMALLVPFMFFFEKLVFGFPDIRKQLAAQAGIFLVVFGLLWLLHPAFEMIRSSLMILLGFFILMISVAMTILFAGKFRENLEEMKARRGQVTAAEVNTMGVVVTAFMLGLNNMHRRKVRTGLTCGTLVLITFAMICFTSIYSDFEDSETAIGRASYQGLLVKNERFGPISGTEDFALSSRYGFEFPLAPRAMLVGVTNQFQERLTPDLEIRHVDAGGFQQSVTLSSIVQFSHHEPLRNQLRMVAGDYWFEPTEEINRMDRIPVILSQSVADRLNVDYAQVADGGVEVEINGVTFLARGVFDEESYRGLQDLDGRSIQPFDIRGLSELERVPGSHAGVLGDEDGFLVDPSEFILAPRVGLGIAVQHSENRLVSIAIDMGEISLREAREEVIQFLEQRARPAFYGIDGISYRGSRMRESSFAGLVDLIIPLIIAALTVLNTMKGSVYERRDEIYVYNAVGIAPKFIFFMFFAEAFVYAVVGSVLGYLLSQGTGTVLTALDLTGGLNMTFASVNSIYASLAVVGAVFVSTYFPAKSAMEIAAPAEDAGWDMPDPEGDSYQFNLPFTFDRRERLAVLAFFNRYFLDHGEGGSASFTSSTPLYDTREGGDGQPEPLITSMIWLKPYDLGVSQRISIVTKFDEETKDYIASITILRESGTKEAWARVNKGFMTQIRKQFLHWRAVSSELKRELFRESRELMEAQLKKEGTHGQG